MAKTRNPLVHGAFDEIAALYARRNPPLPDKYLDGHDKPVPDSQLASMGNLVEFAALDPDLARAHQISKIGNSPDHPPQFKGNIGSQASVTDLSSAVKAIVGPHSALLYGDGKPVTLASAESDDASIEIYSILMAQLLNFADPNNQQIQPVAVVQFGGGGVQAQAEVDWLEGGVIQVPGSFIRVMARLDNLTTIHPTGDDKAVFGAFLSKHLKSRVSKLTRSIRFQLSPAASYPGIPIPAFATEVQLIYVTDAAVPDTRINLGIRGIATDGLATVMWEQPAGSGQIIPIGGNVGSIEIHNYDAAISPLQGWAVFTIEL